MHRTCAGFLREELHRCRRAVEGAGLIISPVPHVEAHAMNSSAARFVSSAVRSFALLLALAPALAVLPGVAARAQQPKVEMHRAGVDSKDASGWYPAASTKGSFSVRMPIPFNDFTVRPSDPKSDPKTGEVTHVIGGKSSEGIKLSAVEIPASDNSAPSLDKVLADFSAKPGSKVSDVQRATKGDVDTLSFSVSGAQTSTHTRMIKTKAATYVLTIEFPNAHRDDVAAIREEFFGSFKSPAIGR
jgi:hypothetical protein